ncbi:beta-lactamase family protein [candidate division KSB1 bacterium]|nr:beta-lactamase family protein [candidate division KSB1 bacterium]
MNIKRLVIYVSVAIIAVGCDKSHQSEVASPIRYSASYKAPVFIDPARIDRIKNVLPEIQKIFESFATQHHYPGLVYGLVADDTLLFSGGVGTINVASQFPVTSKSLFRIASMTKSFTAMAIMKLRDDGKINFLKPAATYVPELDNLTYLTSDASPITIQNLLTMTAGFPEDNPWGDRLLDITDDSLMTLIRNGIPFSSLPSQQFEYSNFSYGILGHIISTVSGMPFEQYITQNILEPLGMVHTFWDFSQVPDSLLALGYNWLNNEWMPEPMLHDGAFGAMGGLITSIEDFSKYVTFLMSAWPPHSGPETGPVKRSTLREMMQPRFPRLSPTSHDIDGTPCPVVYSYGYGLGIAQRCNGDMWISHSGSLPGFASHYVFLPDYGIGIMSFCNRTRESPRNANYAALDVLYKSAGITPRSMPVSDILAERKEQIVQLIRKWDPEHKHTFLADNFYLDKSWDERVKEVNQVMSTIGEITSIGPLISENQLRGTFRIHGKRGSCQVFFSLTPEIPPKVQALDLTVGEQG